MEESKELRACTLGIVILLNLCSLSVQIFQCSWVSCLWTMKLLSFATE